MGDDELKIGPPDSGFDDLAQAARVSARMLRSGKCYSDQEREDLIRAFNAWLTTATDDDGEPMSPARAAAHMKISASVVSQVLRDCYKGDTNRILGLMDQLMADARLREDRLDRREIVAIGIFEKMHGVVMSGIKQNSMPLIIGDPGSCKSAFQEWFASQREGVVRIRIDELNNDRPGVISLLYEAMRLQGEQTYRAKLQRIITVCSKTRNIVLFVDECQKLKGDGLEMLRDVHDRSDPAGRHNVPIVFFGDTSFNELLVHARDGQRSPIKPQMTRRMYPVFNVQLDGPMGGDGLVFTAEDVGKILARSQLRVINPDGVQWLTKLSNTPGWGALGFALAVARMAFDVAKNRHCITPADLCRGLKMLIGPRQSEHLDSRAGGELLRAAAG